MSANYATHEWECVRIEEWIWKMIHINHDEPSVQVNFLLRINTVSDAIDIKQPGLLRRLTWHAAEGLLTGKRFDWVACLASHERRVSCEEKWIFRLARVDPVPDR